jgi:hypothetical protein
MPDFAQVVFDRGEEIAQQLHYMEGCDAALMELLDTALATAPMHVQGAVYAVVEAQRLFRANAVAHAERLTKEACLH